MRAGVAGRRGPRATAAATHDGDTWRRVALRSTDRAWSRFSGDDDFFVLYQDWAEILLRG